MSWGCPKIVRHCDPILLLINTFGIHLEPGCKSHEQIIHYHTAKNVLNKRQFCSIFRRIYKVTRKGFPVVWPQWRNGNNDSLFFRRLSVPASWQNGTCQNRTATPTPTPGDRGRTRGQWEEVERETPFLPSPDQRSLSRVGGDNPTILARTGNRTDNCLHWWLYPASAPFLSRYTQRSGSSPHYITTGTH